MSGSGYGLPLKCPKCPPERYFGVLKVPGSKSVPCPNCGTKLVPVTPRVKGLQRAGGSH